MNFEFFSLSLPTYMGPPGNLFDVNIAANESVGWSVLMSDTFIGRCFSTSNGVKVKRVVPTENPEGRRETDFKCSIYEA